MLVKISFLHTMNFSGMKKRFTIKFFLSYILCLTFYVVAYAQAGEWTWMKGDSTPNSLGNFGTQGIPNSANTPPALYEAANWTDHEGNFWLFGGLNYYPSQAFNSALWKFDPATNEWTWVKGSSSSN